MRRKVEENKSIVTKRSEQCETNRCDFKTYDNITTKKLKNCFEQIDD